MIKKLLIATCIVLLLLLGGALYLYHSWMGFVQTPLQFPQYPYDIMVAKGSSFNQITEQLQKDGVIEHTYWLRIYARTEQVAHKVQAGYYQIQNPMTPAEFLRYLASGQVVTYKVTLVEGWTFKDILAHLAQNTQLTHTLEGMSVEQVMQALDLADLQPEGWFFPSTYQFNQGERDVDILKRAHQQMQQILAQEWELKQPNLPYKTPYEALIMASIVEKETGVAHERPDIAGVFVRRLNLGMKLQTDPTVIYGMGDSYQGNIRRKDLRTDTPYNTYTRDGLPPTPIAMPGQEAIHAALHPSEGKTLYFVAMGDGTGQHYFSETLDEHNKAVRKFQLSGKK